MDIPMTPASNLSDREIRGIYVEHWKLDDDEFPFVFARAIEAKVLARATAEPVATRYARRSATIEAITFDEFVQFGRDNGANIVNGMPWSFKYKGLSVSHESDTRYIVGSFDFHKGDFLVTMADGWVETRKAESFLNEFMPVHPSNTGTAFGDLMLHKFGPGRLGGAASGASPEKAGALYDSAYLAGVNLGFTLGLENNNAAKERVFASRKGYLSALAAGVPTPEPTALQTAIDIRVAQGWKLGGNKIPILYTDTINDEQVCRDDLWIATTAALAAGVPTPEPTCIECDGPVEWRCPACKINNFARAVPPEIPPGSASGDAK